MNSKDFFTMIQIWNTSKVLFKLSARNMT